MLTPTHTQYARQQGSEKNPKSFVLSLKEAMCTSYIIFKREEEEVIRIAIIMNRINMIFFVSIN